LQGDSKSGASNKSDFLVKILVGLIQLKHYPTSDVYFEMTPVDFLSKTIGSNFFLIFFLLLVSLSKLERYGSVFNLANNNKEKGVISLQLMVDCIIEHGYSMEPVTEYSNWYKQLEQSANNALEPLLSYFVYFFPGEQVPTIYHHKVSVFNVILMTIRM
jgi:thioester reductase-like protein